MDTPCTVCSSREVEFPSGAIFGTMMAWAAGGLGVAVTLAASTQESGAVAVWGWLASAALLMAAVMCSIVLWPTSRTCVGCSHQRDVHTEQTETTAERDVRLARRQNTQAMVGIAVLLFAVLGGCALISGGNNSDSGYEACLDSMRAEADSEDIGMDHEDYAKNRCTDAYGNPDPDAY